MEIITNTIDYAREYLKCKLSPLYFIENYIKIPVPGGIITQPESDIWNATPKYRDLIKLYMDEQIQNIAFQASRQHAKTTTVAQLVLHALIFYPRMKIEMLTLTKKNAEDTVERILFMHNHLPKWLQVGFKGKADYKTYILFSNDSRFNTRFISGNISPDTVARGMSVPFLWVDEAAFIPHMEEAWAAAQPAIATARKFALLNKVPTKIIMTSTPNGAGENFFYKTWSRAWDYTEVMDLEKRKVVPNAQEILNSNPDKNNFVKLKIHWSETGKTEEWYQRQIKELQFNMRKVNQELNLVFLGSAFTIFPDEVIAEFKPKKEIKKIDIGYGNYFSLFEDIEEILSENKEEVFILGVDTAVSTAAKADYSAIVLTKGSTGEQIGEWHGKVSVLKRYGIILKKLILNLLKHFDLDEDNFKVIIERNSIGLSIVEDLQYDDEFDFGAFLYRTEIRKGEKAPGIATKKDTREKMFDLLLSIVNENPGVVQGPLIQEELRNLEQKSSGRIEAGNGTHDDIIMAYNFTLFVREELIKNGIIASKHSPKRFDKNTIINDVDVALSSINNYQSFLDTKSKNDDFIFTTDFENEKAKKDIEKYKKQLMKELTPKGMNYTEEEDIIGYDIIAF